MYIKKNDTFLFLKQTVFFFCFLPQMDSFAMGMTLWAMVTRRMPKGLDGLLDLPISAPFLGTLIKVLTWRVAKNRPTIKDLLVKMRSAHAAKLRDLIDSL